MASFSLNDIAQMIIHPDTLSDNFDYSFNADGDKDIGENLAAKIDISPNSDPLPVIHDRENVNEVHCHGDAWILPSEDFNDPFIQSDAELAADTRCTVVSYKDDQKTVLARLPFDVSNDIHFGIDFYEQLRLSSYVCGMEKGSPSAQDNSDLFEFNILEEVYTDYDIRQIVGHHKRSIRLPIGPTASVHIRDKMRMMDLGVTTKSPRGETMWENWVTLSDDSMGSDPLQLLSVTTGANKILAKDLLDFRNRIIDTCEELQYKKSEKLSMYFNNGQYSIVVGKNKKEIVYCGNYDRSFLFVIFADFDKVKRRLSSLSGVQMICELTEYEKAQLTDVTGNGRLYRIEFDSFKSYDHALHTSAVKYGFTKFPILIDASLPTTTKQLCLHFKWFIWPSKRQALIVLDKADLSHCEKVLEAHDFLVYDITSRCYEENADDAKIIIKAKSTDMFNRMWHYENDLKDVIHKILHSNNICYKRMSLSRKRQQDIDRELSKVIAEVNSRIIRSAFNCVENVWSRQKVPNTKELDDMARNSSQLPWDVIVKEYDSNSVEAVIEVRFRDEVFGRAVVDYMMPRSPDIGFFNLYKHDRIGVRIYPFYRITIPVPRNIIEACISDLSACDLYYGDAEPEASSVSVDRLGSRNSFAKIIASSSIDSLTVELWPERILPGALSSLNTVLEGRTVDCSREPYSMLLFGRGLKWLISLAKHSEPFVVLSVDRLRARISLYGSTNNLATFMETLQFFCFKTDEYVIRDRISMGLPRFLPCMAKILSKVVGRKHLCAMFGDISFSELDLSIVFRGSLKKLNELQVFLDDLNEKVFVNTAPSVRLIWSPIPYLPEFTASRPICPVCLCNVRISAYCLEACGHYYCLECLCEQINHQTRTREFPWCCLNPLCGEEILMSDIKELMCIGGSIPFWFAQRYLHHLLDPLRDWVIRDPSSGYCSCDTPNCEGLFKKIADSYESQEGDQKVDQPSDVCTDCGVTRCLNCLHFAHNGMSCWQSAKVNDDVDASIAHFKESNANARNCPNINCGAVIQKDDGCNHIFCPYCKVHFCWTCSKSFDSSQLVYAHMHSVHGGFGGGWVIENDVIVDRPIEEEL